VVPALPVPRLVKFAGTLTDEQSKPRTGAVGVTFAIYKEQQGGAALWVETQNVELDEQGRYTVLLGATKSEGLPLELFATGEPRWLGVQVNVAKELEQPRVLLVSVPYALKAADAETLGGKPLSSFVLATLATGGVVGVGTALNPATGAILPATIGGGGNQNFVAKFDVTGANVINSSLFDNGQVGIGTTSPGALLDVQLTTGAAANALNSKITLNNSSANTGSVVSAFKMTLLDESTAVNLSKQPARFAYVRDVSATGGVTAFDAVMTATSFLNASAPYPLRGVNIEGPTMATGTTLDTFYGGYIGSGGGAGVVTNRFALVTEPGAGNVGLGTIAPSQKLEVAGNLKISGGGNALVFPDGSVMSSAATGVGGGTITGVMAGTGLTGGGTTGGVALNIASGGITNALLGANSVTNANIADGSLSQTKIAGVAATLGPNSFTGNQSIIGSLGIGTLSPRALTQLDVVGTVANPIPIFGETSQGGGSIGVEGISFTTGSLGVLGMNQGGGGTPGFDTFNIGVAGQSNGGIGVDGSVENGGVAVRGRVSDSAGKIFVGMGPGGAEQFNVSSVGAVQANAFQTLTGIPIAQYINLQLYGANIAGGASFTTGFGHFAGMQLPNAGVPSFAYEFTIPPSFISNSPLTVHVIWYTSVTSCTMTLAPNFISVARAGRTHIVGAGATSGLTGLGGDTLIAPATANVAQEKQYTITSPDGVTFLDAGDVVVFGLFRTSSGAGDCGANLTVEGVSITY
jgi:hypothetical protein